MKVMMLIRYTNHPHDFFAFRKIDLLYSNTVLILVYIFLYQIILHNYNTNSSQK